MRLSELRNPPVQKVIAAGRVLLTAVALLAVELDPTHPEIYAAETRLLLTLYLIFALALVLMPITLWWKIDAHFSSLEHAIDTLFVSTLLYLTDILPSPFFIFVTFILLSATLRWGWRAVITTTVAVLLLVAGLGAAQGPFALVDLNRVLIRAEYLVVITGLFAYASAFLENSHLRLSRLAVRPDLPAKTGGPVLDPLLQHVANVAKVPRVLVAWRLREEPASHSVMWDKGVSTHTIESSPRLIDGPHPGLRDEPYLTGDLGRGGFLAASGWRRRGGPSAAAFAADFAITSMVTAPFQGSVCQGRIYLLDGQVWAEENLALSSLIAAQIGLEIDRHVLLEELAASAIAAERARLGRDIHDSVLQTLAAAALQLKLMETQDLTGTGSERAALVREMLAEEQRRVRAFVDSTKQQASAAKTVSLNEEIADLARRAASKWGLNAAASIRPPGAVVHPEIGKQVKLLISEAIANSARHGKAARVGIKCSVNGATLSIQIEDDGHGFPELSGRFGHGDLVDRRLGPASIVARTSELGGRVEMTTSKSGTTLDIELPLQ
jgi:signal transduction histidine kinase